MSFEEVRTAPEKLDPFLKGGQTVTVTKDGMPYFDAVPVRRSTRKKEFDRKIDELWAGTGIERSTEEIVEGLRESRE